MRRNVVMSTIPPNPMYVMRGYLLGESNCIYNTIIHRNAILSSRPQKSQPCTNCNLLNIICSNGMCMLFYWNSIVKMKKDLYLNLTNTIYKILCQLCHSFLIQILDSIEATSIMFIVRKWNHWRMKLVYEQYQGIIILAYFKSFWNSQSNIIHGCVFANIKKHILNIFPLLHGKLL